MISCVALWVTSACGTEEFLLIEDLLWGGSPLELRSTDSTCLPNHQAFQNTDGLPRKFPHRNVNSSLWRCRLSTQNAEPRFTRVPNNAFVPSARPPNPRLPSLFGRGNAAHRAIGPNRVSTVTWHFDGWKYPRRMCRKPSKGDAGMVGSRTKRSCG
jgi:hypothetical protein